jgi:hypothetical protein
MLNHNLFQTREKAIPKTRRPYTAYTLKTIGCFIVYPTTHDQIEDRHQVLHHELPYN